MGIYHCDEATGEWEYWAVCEAPFVDVVGTLVTTQQLESTGATCPPLRPRGPIAMTIPSLGAVTVAGAVTVVEASASPGFDRAWASLSFTADWAGVEVAGSYEFWIDDDRVDGEGHVTAGDCQATIALEVQLCPLGLVACQVDDEGWDVRCASGVVRVDERTRYGFCRAGERTPVCTVGGPGGAGELARCAEPAACVDDQVRSFDTYEAYAAFDPQTLCAPAP